MLNTNIPLPKNIAFLYISILFLQNNKTLLSDNKN